MIFHVGQSDEFHGNEPCKCIRMIEYLLLRYDAMFRKNEIKVEQEIEKNCFAYGNRMYLERAVNNYLMNAFQHTEQGKRIRITLKKEKKQDTHGSLQRWRAD